MPRVALTLAGLALLLSASGTAAADGLAGVRDRVRRGSPAERREAVEALVALDSEAAVVDLAELVRRSLADLEALAPALDRLDVAYHATQAEAEQREALREWKRASALLERHLEVVGEAGRALGRVRSEQARARIGRGALRESDPLVRQFLVAALGAVADRRSLPALLDLTAHRDPRSRALAAGALRSFVTRPGVFDRLAALSRDGAWTVRLAAYESLARAPLEVAVPFLVDAAGREEGQIALHVDALLASLTGRSFADEPRTWAYWWDEHGEACCAGTYEDPREFPLPVSRPSATFFRIPLHSRNLVFVIDHSASMEEPLEIHDAVTNQVRAELGLRATRLGYAKAELVRAIRSLPDGTRFNVVQYGDAAVRLAPRPLAASEGSRQRALRWVLAQESRGTTNLWAALRESFQDHLARVGASTRYEDLPDTIVLLTDGTPTRGLFQRAESLLALVRLWNGAVGAVIHTVGLGADQDRDLLAGLARETGGLYYDFAQGTPSLVYVPRGVPPEDRAGHGGRRRVAARAALAAPEPEVRLGAVAALRALGAFAAPDLALWTQALADPDPGVRDAALAALDDLGPALALEPLSATLAHRDPGLRVLAARAVGAMGPEAAAAAPALERMAASPDPAVAEAAREALARLAGR